MRRAAIRVVLLWALLSLCRQAPCVAALLASLPVTHIPDQNVEGNDRKPLFGWAPDGLHFGFIENGGRLVVSDLTGQHVRSFKLWGRTVLGITHTSGPVPVLALIWSPDSKNIGLLLRPRLGRTVFACFEAETFAKRYTIRWSTPKIAGLQPKDYDTPDYVSAQFSSDGRWLAVERRNYDSHLMEMSTDSCSLDVIGIARHRWLYTEPNADEFQWFGTGLVTRGHAGLVYRPAPDQIRSWLTLDRNSGYEPGCRSADQDLAVSGSYLFHAEDGVFVTAYRLISGKCVRLWGKSLQLPEDFSSPGETCDISVYAIGGVALVQDWDEGEQDPLALIWRVDKDGARELSTTLRFSAASVDAVVPNGFVVSIEINKPSGMGGPVEVAADSGKARQVQGLDEIAVVGSLIFAPNLKVAALPPHDETESSLRVYSFN